MKMGIKEFRERIGEVARGDEPVTLTDRGRVVGVYSPLPRWTPEKRERAHHAISEIKRWREKMQASDINTDQWLTELGLDPWGAPLPGAHDR